MLFTAEEDEPNGASRQQPRGFDGARGFDDQRRVAAIVERASAELPGIEMRPKNHNFVRPLITANFTHNIFLLCRPPNFIRHVQMHANFPGIGGNGSRQSHGVFPGKDGLRHLVNFTVQ